ncbi:hypothetical protein BDN72DRAFT_848180 [Pluteus cervinus]|uniref:Uncharacterized protein n=1 Tax=Pluteus cervinus TaxID=181527 RepID=A0ACD3AB61_9AGAR|nr:hypothetical protein BDN72DRAFT_848180 [Pluteus cervinus]
MDGDIEQCSALQLVMRTITMIEIDRSLAGKSCNCNATQCGTQQCGCKRMQTVCAPSCHPALQQCKNL